MTKHQWYAVFLASVMTSWALLPALGSSADDQADVILKRFMAEWVQLTPGKGRFPASFTMGSGKEGLANEQPAHPVRFAYDFAMAKYEVTQELFALIMAQNPSKWKGKRNSVDMVSWPQAREFCRKLTAALHQRRLLPKNEEIRLPSEAEWEYACRAGTTTRYSFGDKVEDLTHYGWFKGNSKGYDPPVGQKKPNPWGLYDMHGYIWEWCADAWNPSYQGAPSDGSAWVNPGSKERVLRGGAWSAPADAARSAFRHHLPMETRSDAIGFRCVRAKKKGVGNGG